MEPKTLADIFFTSVTRDSERVIMFKRRGTWENVSSRQYYGYVVSVAHALKQWGIHRGDRVAILSENRPEWMITDFACVCSGIIDVPIYTTLTADQTAYLHDREFDEAAHNIQLDEIATLIYTSGTTGTSKGVMLSHGNLTSNAVTSTKNFEWADEDLYLSFLPLSHVTARHLDYVCFLHGATIAYCPYFDQLPQMLQEVKPTIIVAVPRVYEKVRQEAERHAAAGAKRKIFDWAREVGERYKAEIARGEVPRSVSWNLANKLVYSKIRQGFGGRSRVYCSGGAPLGADMAEWFACMGIPIYEGYGLTETSPVISSNRRAGYKIGTVGKPVETIQIKIAEDGEILVKGPTVFKGYWNMPEETRAAFTPDGWFKTGDIGQLDADGFLNITDRKKELIKTSGGKFIAPQPIENALKNNVLIAQAAVIGDKRKFASVIISPHFPMLEDWARANGVAFTSHQELVNHQRVREMYRGIVEDLNKKLAHFETIKKILVVPDEFTIATGEITPTMKLKRRNVEARYKQQIDELYHEPHPAEAAPVG